MSRTPINDVERIKQWLERPRMACHSLQLVHEQAMSAGVTIASWEKEQATNPEEIEQVAQAIMTEAQDHADNIGESCRFALQWLGTTGRVKTQMTLRVAQTAGTEQHEGASAAHAVSSNAIVGQLLGALDKKDRQMNAALGSVFVSMERVLKIQNEMLERVAGQLANVNANAPSKVPELPEALVAKLGRNAELQSRALEKLIDIGPDVLKLGIAAAARHFGILVEDDDEAPKAPGVQ